MIACANRFERPDGQWECPDCGKVTDRKHLQACGKQPPRHQYDHTGTCEVCGWRLRPDLEPRCEKGLGDRLAAILKRVGVERLLKWTGKDCGCGKRAKWLNRVWWRITR